MTPPYPTDFTPVADVFEPATPGPGARLQRTAGQLGGTSTFIALWQAFGWFGADRWTADEASLRWPAIFGASMFAISGVQNLANWWRARSVERAAERAAAPAPPVDTSAAFRPDALPVARKRAARGPET